MPEKQISKERALYLRHRKMHRNAIIILRIAILVGFFALWELAAYFGWIDAFIMSSPSRMAETVVNLYTSGELFLHIGMSCLQ